VVHQPTEKLLDALKADLVEAMINHLKMMSSHGNEDLLAQLLRGRRRMTVDSTLVMRLLLDLLLLGLEIDLAAMVVVPILITEALALVLATMPPLLPTRLHGLSRLQLTQPPLHTQDMQLLATPAVINLKELHLASPLRLD
jgi:uncharacterized membrane protein